MAEPGWMQSRPVGLGRGPDPAGTPRSGGVDAATVRSESLEGSPPLNPPPDSVLPGESTAARGLRSGEGRRPRPSSRLRFMTRCTSAGRGRCRPLLSRREIGAATPGARDQSQLVSPCLGQAAGVQQGGRGPREQGRSVSPGIRQRLPAGWAGTASPPGDTPDSSATTGAPSTGVGPTGSWGLRPRAELERTQCQACRPSFRRAIPTCCGSQPGGEGGWAAAPRSAAREGGAAASRLSPCEGRTLSSSLQRSAGRLLLLTVRLRLGPGSHHAVPPRPVPSGLSSGRSGSQPMTPHSLGPPISLL